MNWSSRTVKWRIVAFLVLSSFLAALPTFTGRFQLVLFTEALIWGTYALSFDLVFGYAGLLSFGQSIFFGIGGYTILYGLKLGFGAGISLALVFLVACIAGLVIGAAIVRAEGSRFFLITLVGSILFYTLATDNSWLTGGTDGMVIPGKFLGLSGYYYLVLGITLVTIVLIWLLVNSPLGLGFKLIRDNKERARLLGYSVKNFRVLAFSIGAGIAGLAGGLYGYTTGFVTAGFFHWTKSADAVVWTVLGGTGTIIGPFLGAALLTFVENMVSALTGKFYTATLGLLLIATITLFPDGIAGILKKLLGKIRVFFNE